MDMPVCAATSPSLFCFLAAAPQLPHQKQRPSPCASLTGPATHSSEHLRTALFEEAPQSLYPEFSVIKLHVNVSSN